MASLKISQPGYGGNSKLQPPKMVIKSATGTKIALYRSPRVTAHSGVGQNWVESPRVGRQAVMRRESQKLPSYSFDITLGHQDWYKEVNWDLNRLIWLANNHQPVTITYSKFESGLYHITDFSYSILLRSPFTNEPTRVSIQMTVVKANIVTIKTGPISRAKPAKKPAKKASARKYKVKKGDTLWAISLKYYGNALKWPKIADYNKVRNPRLLQIGTILTIPSL